MKSRNYSTEFNLRPRNPQMSTTGTISYKTALKKISALNMVPKLYNKLHQRLKILSQDTFRRELSRLFIEKCYYTVDEY